MSRYIDADKIEYAPCTICQYKGKDVTEMIAYKSLIDIMPTADVEEVRHGQWLCINGTIFCSECGEKALYEYNKNDNDDFPFLLPTRSKRCPHCGARMHKESENE